MDGWRRKTSIYYASCQDSGNNMFELLEQRVLSYQIEQVHFADPGLHWA